MALQRLTTCDPDDSMLEVAIVAFKRVLLADGRLTAKEVMVPGVVPVDQSGQALPDDAVLAPEPAVSRR
jgi:hypothetical protein